MRRLATLLAAVLLLSAALVDAEEVSLVVVVHPSRRVSLTLDDVARIFLERRRFWDDGKPILALNLPAGTPLREFFSHRVLRRSSSALGEYWNQQYFHGLLPPPVLSSPEAVKSYVAADPNAIGYITAGQVDASVRVVLALE